MQIEMNKQPETASDLQHGWASDVRWDSIRRDYSAEDVLKLRNSFPIAYTLAERSAHTEDYVNALGALTGGQAVQMVKAGLKAIYLSGWQVAADANTAGQTYPDQSLYPANSVPRWSSASTTRSSAPTRSRTPEGPGTDLLVRADRGRRRGRLRRPAQRLRAHEGDDRGGRRGRPLRGPARLREEVRPPRRQGARPDRGRSHPQPHRRAARRRRDGRADAPHRPHRRRQRQAPHLRHRRARPALRRLRRRPHGRGLLPGQERHRALHRPRHRLRALLPT
jgi:hypothetical protein